MKVGDLVKVKCMPTSDYGIILSINNTSRWTKVYWITIADSWSFYSDDLEVVVESR
jgi:hypothetical protein